MKTKAILFVDDEQMVLCSLQRGFLDEPYNLLFADSGQKALDLLEHNEVHIVVTDMRMPEMSGLEFLKIVKSRWPDVVRVILSGFTDRQAMIDAINQGEIFKFITKPWRLEEDFKLVIQQAARYYDNNVEANGLKKELEQRRRAAMTKAQ